MLWSLCFKTSMPWSLCIFLIDKNYAELSKDLVTLSWLCISDSEGAELSTSQVFLRELSIQERHLQKYTQLVRYNNASLSCPILVEFIEEKFRRIVGY